LLHVVHSTLGNGDCQRREEGSSYAVTPCPGGTFDNSPVIYRWGVFRRNPSKINVSFATASRVGKGQ
ncbi:MAG: hypothetical protein WBM35_04800, partial [Candidatus Electrothrix sp.]